MTGARRVNAGKIESTVLFDVPADVPHRELTRATEAGLAAARAALADRGSVEAIGRLPSARGDAKRVRVELVISVADGMATIALAAERAFAEAFAGALTTRGYAAVRL